MANLPHPAEFPDLPLPLRSRRLTLQEMNGLRDAARTGLYSPLQLAHAYSISRSLAFAIFAKAITRSPILPRDTK